MGLLSHLHDRAPGNRQTGGPIGVFSDRSMTQAFNLLSGVTPGGIGAPPLRGTAEYLRAYSEMPWLRAVTSRIATSVARSEWQLYVARTPAKNGKPPSRARLTSHVRQFQKSADRLGRKALLKQMQDNDDLDQIVDHPFLEVLTNANSFQTGVGMRKVTQLHLDLVGDAFWLKERDKAGTVIAVWPIPPNWIMATPTPAFRFFRVSFRAWRGLIPDTEWVWFSDDDPLNPYARGSATARSLADELETDEYTAKHTKSFFYNQARPDLLIWPTSSSMRPEEVTRLEERWMSQNQGFWRAFKPMFLNREVEVREMDSMGNFRAQQLVQLRQFSRDTILQTFGLPPEILGVLENSNRATIDAADYLMSRYVVEPRLEFMRSTLQERLIPEYDERLMLEYVSPVQDDHTMQLEAASKATWCLTTDEWRAMAGHKPLDDEDAGAMFMVPTLVKPMSAEDLAEPPPPPTPIIVPPTVPAKPPESGEPPAKPPKPGEEGKPPSSEPPKLPASQPPQTPKPPDVGGAPTATPLEATSTRARKAPRPAYHDPYDDANEPQPSISSRRNAALDEDIAVALSAGDHALAASLERFAQTDPPDMPKAVDAAAKLEPSCARSLLRTWQDHQARLNMAKLAAALTATSVHGDVVAALDIPALNRSQTAVLVPQLQRGFLQGSQVGADILRHRGIQVRNFGAPKAGAIAVDLEGVNPLAVQWANDHAAELLQAPADIQEQVAMLVAQSTAGDYTPVQLARILRSVIGLNPSRVTAVFNYEARLTAAGIAAETVADKVGRYALAQLRDRAMLVARTELMGALNNGQRAAWSQAVQQNAIRADSMEQVWIATDGACDDCDDLDGTTAPIDGTFDDGSDGPPEHPACRCTTGLQDVSEKTLKQRRKQADIAATERVVYVVRHGKTASDEDPHRHDGWLPTPLNEAGKATAQRLAVRFADVRPLHIISSPCLRALQTATYLVDGDSAVTISVDQRLGPWRIGPTFEGQIEDDVDQALQALIQQPSVLPPGDGTESWEQCVARVTAAFTDAISEASWQTGTLLLTHSWDGQIIMEHLDVTHGFPLPSRQLEPPKPPPGTVIRLVIDEAGKITSAEESPFTGEPFPALAPIVEDEKQRPVHRPAQPGRPYYQDPSNDDPSMNDGVKP